MHKYVLATALGLAITSAALVGCGGGGDDAPSDEDLVEALVDGAGYTQEEATCTAEQLRAAGLSDEVIEAIATNDESTLSGDEEERAQQAIEAAGEACISVPSTTAPSTTAAAGG